jgi:hypothetical protein
MFCKRDSDGIDWYDFIFFNGSPFAPGSIKITIDETNKVMVATRDESSLFPQRMTVLEVTGGRRRRWRCHKDHVGIRHGDQSHRSDDRRYRSGTEHDGRADRRVVRDSQNSLKELH